MAMTEDDRQWIASRAVATTTITVISIMVVIVLISINFDSKLNALEHPVTAPSTVVQTPGELMGYTEKCINETTVTKEVLVPENYNADCVRNSFFEECEKIMDVGYVGCKTERDCLNECKSSKSAILSKCLDFCAHCLFDKKNDRDDCITAKISSIDNIRTTALRLNCYTPAHLEHQTTTVCIEYGPTRKVK